MNEMEKEYYDRFEIKLQDDLLRLCTSYQQLDGVLIASEDIDGHWNVLGPQYLADAVEQVRDYPIVSVAWAAIWEPEWPGDGMQTGRGFQGSLPVFYGEQGFDDMDEHIVKDLLGFPLDSQEAAMLENSIRRCAEHTVAAIRHEQIEPQSAMAYHIFARACKVMYRIGAAMQLKRMHYQLEKVQLN